MAGQPAGTQGVDQTLAERSTAPELLEALKRKLGGYYNYYGVTGNSCMLAKYDLNVKWLNRRSRRRSMTRAEFLRRLSSWELPSPKVVEKLA